MSAVDAARGLDVQINPRNYRVAVENSHPGEA
jgi:hypothetical protein